MWNQLAQLWYRDAILLVGLGIVLSWTHAQAASDMPTSGTVARVAVFEGIALTSGTIEPPPEEIRTQMIRRRLPCDILTADRLIAGEGLVGERRYDLLIIPCCDIFPDKAIGPLLQYLKSGGRMLLIGGRPFSNLVTRHNGSWLTEEDIQKWRDRIPTEEIVIPFSEKELAAWRHASGPPGKGTRMSIEPSGRKDIANALRVDVAGLKNWDTVARSFDQPFPNDAPALTCFWARGSKDTPQLSIEWVEKDGSRWIATVELKAEWQHYVLRPQQFRYWPDNPSKGRGGPGDRFDPRNARALVVGLSDTHTKDVSKGDHTYWIADIGWSHDVAAPRIEAMPPDLEILSPWYKTYVTNRAKFLQTATRVVLSPADQWPAPSQIVSPVARTTGAGFAPSRTYRWIPRVVAVDENGEECGTAESVLIWRSGEFAHSAWGFLGISDMDDLGRRRTQTLYRTSSIAAFLTQGVFLIQGGAEASCYFEGEPWSFRAEVANCSADTATVSVDLTVDTGTEGRISPWAKPKQIFSSSRLFVKVAPRQNLVISFPNFTESLPARLYRVVIRLQYGPEHDTIEQIVRVVPRDRKPDPKRLVRVRGGDFEVNGKPWLPFGINFWPLSVAGTPDMEWRLPRNYDPERVQRDLERVRAYGMNVVCIQLHSEDQARPTIDFLERCRALDIRAFVFLPGGNPLNPNPGLMHKLIRAAHLAESDAVFAYDVAWEPRVGEEEQRHRLDGRWRDWIVERYGSIENAEKDWGFTAPRDPKGQAAGPMNEQILNDGPQRVMVAAYRRFLDDTISQGYGAVTRAIREVDPYHLIGVRSGYGGTGSPWADPHMPFDLASGAKHLDFISPEGYGHGPSWETVRNAGLTTLYGRMVSGGKPVWWAEYGMSILKRDAPQTAMEGKRQGELYANFARMFVESRANGGAGWWFPGGYRINEDSDFGIFNPDGSPRPAALANREWSERVAAIRASVKKAREKSEKEKVETDGNESALDVLIRVDRDLHPRGYSQIRARHEKQYLAAVEAGKSVILVTEATGTHSANVPLVAVGNRPYNGNNPPKYLNAEFEGFWIKVGNEPWREVQNGERVGPVANLSRARIVGRAKVANTGQAAWLTPKDPRAASGGGIYLVSTRNSELSLRIPLSTETPPLGDCLFDEFEIMPNRTTDWMIEIELEAASRARFGQHFRMQLVAQ